MATPALARLWCDPFRTIDPSWLAAGDDTWVASLQRSPGAAPLVHRLACSRLGLAAAPLPPVDSARSALLLSMPLDAAELLNAACVLGLAAFAMQDGFATVWMKRSAALLSAAPAAAWRTAIAASRARTLPVTPGALAEARTSAEFTQHGLALLAATCDALLPGLWARLRLRCARHWFDMPAFTCASLQPDAASCRQVMRLCATASGGSDSSGSGGRSDSSHSPSALPEAMHRV